jgi:hypothetical protein
MCYKLLTEKRWNIVRRLLRDDLGLQLTVVDSKADEVFALNITT